MTEIIVGFIVAAIVIAYIIIMDYKKTKKAEIAMAAKQAAEWAVSTKNPDSPNYDPNTIYDDLEKMYNQAKK